MHATSISSAPAERSTRSVIGAKLLFAAPCLVVAALGLWQAAMVAWTWLALSQAAAAGAHEAVLPHATRASIEAAVDRALAARVLAQARQPIEITLNEWPAGDASLPYATRGDRLAVRVGLPASAVTPDWLRFIGLSLRRDTLTAAAVVRKP